MAVQCGRDLLIKMDMSGDGMFETIAGLRATRLSFNAETVDVTNMASPGGWRELLAGAGVKAAQLSGSGVFRDAATDARARSAFFGGEIPRFQVVIPDFGTVEGPFQITALDYAGTHNGEATYEMALASAGVLVFAPPDEAGGEPEDYMGAGEDPPPEVEDGEFGPGEGDEMPPVGEEPEPGPEPEPEPEPDPEPEPEE